jgi:hypothetical protein
LNDGDSGRAKVRSQEIHQTTTSNSTSKKGSSLRKKLIAIGLTLMFIAILGAAGLAVFMPDNSLI